MVNNVEISNVVHQMLPGKPKISINRRSGAFQERPSLGLVLRYVGMGMMQVCDGDDPVVDPQIRHYIQQQNGFGSDYSACVPKAGNGQANTNIRS